MRAIRASGSGSHTKMTMRVHRHNGAGSFWDAAGSWLLESEAANNLIIGVALRNSRDTSRAVPDEYWATVQDAGRVVGCAFRTPPMRAALSPMPAAATALLCDDLLERFGELPGVTGEIGAARAFADHWADREGGKWVTHLSLRIHVLESVKFPETPPAGGLRVATDADTDRVRDWLVRFVDETDAALQIEEFVRFAVGERRARIWEDRGPRCLVVAARETPGCGTINAVYTPMEHRRRGYATAAVAALSQELLNGGKQVCALYTDLANPTSNSIYAAIGYRPVREDVEITFLRQSR